MEFEILPPLSRSLGPFTIHYETLFMVTVVSGLLILMFYLFTRRLKPADQPPGRLQALAEIAVEGFDKLVGSAMGKKRARKYLPFIGTLFFFVWFCNIISLVPYTLGQEIEIFGLKIPNVEEPTKNINVPLGLAVLFLTIVHGSAIKIHGLKHYFWEYASPAIVIAGVKIPNLPLMGLNIVGELAKSVSLPFRLFGNLFGGAVIFTLAFTFAAQFFFVPLPLGLTVFFGLFVGTVQAFVFTTLAMTYIVVMVGED